MGKERDNGPPAADGGDSGDHRIPGEENSPYWVDHDPFAVRREQGTPASPPASEARHPPTPAPIARDPASFAKQTPPKQVSQDAPKAAVGTVNTGPASTIETQREAKVSVDPTLAIEPAPTPGAATGASSQAPPRETSTRHPARAASPAPDAKAAAIADPPHPSKPVEVAVATKPPAPPRTPAPFSDDDFVRPSGWRLFRLPLWAWVLAIVLSTAVLLLVIDLRNKHRYRLRCVASHLQAQSAKRFPWPFGYETLGGLLRPVVVPPEADCVAQHFRSLEEVESAFLTFILDQVRIAVSNPAARSLRDTRAQLTQALQLTRREAHAGRRDETRRLLADLSYREGRAGLARVEMNLREALALLQQAQKLGGDRYEDLDDWIAHLEHLLRSVAPSPGTPRVSASPSPTRPSPTRPRPAVRKQPTPSALGTPAPLPRTVPRPRRAAQRDAGAPSDAGTGAGSGILM